MASRCYFWIEHHLNYALSVSQVNKYQSPMVATAVYPTSQGYLKPNMLSVQLTTAMAFEQNRLLIQNAS
jgi:hypothetical protein